MARVHFGIGIVYGLYEKPINKRTLPSKSFIEKPIVYCGLPTELEALRELPEWTVKTETVGYVNITSNWIGEIQQCFRSTQQPYGRIQYFNRQLLGNNILAFNFCIDFIDFIFLYFYHHLCNYCNRVFSDQSSYVVCRCLYKDLCYFSVYRMACDVLDKANQKIKVKEDIRSRYAKYVFLPGKINSVIISLVLLGLFTDRNDSFPCPFIYFS